MLEYCDLVLTRSRCGGNCRLKNAETQLLAAIEGKSGVEVSDSIKQADNWFEMAKAE